MRIYCEAGGWKANVVTCKAIEGSSIKNSWHLWRAVWRRGIMCSTHFLCTQECNSFCRLSFLLGTLAQSPNYSVFESTIPTMSMQTLLSHDLPTKLVRSQRTNQHPIHHRDVVSCTFNLVCQFTPHKSLTSGYDLLLVSCRTKSQWRLLTSFHRDRQTQWGCHLTVVQGILPCCPQS